ncbi:hypothetical protein ACH9L7_18440 (plasmid) [Haloferax sp. S1W]|uniref:hypothetical protein n=1 Tax=Haloferax sp. S1W TaxID=3377110 RepID=UPI0037CBA298
MFDRTDIPDSCNRRTALKSTGTLIAACAGSGVVSARKKNKDKSVRLSGTYENPIPLGRIKAAQKKNTYKWMGIKRNKNIKPSVVPNLSEGERVVDYRLLYRDGSIQEHIGTATDPATVEGAKSDGEEFQAQVENTDTIGIQQASSASIDISGWDWDYFSRYNARNKPAGKITIGSHWTGKEDAPDNGDFGYAIATEYGQTPGTDVNDWGDSASYWHNYDARVRNKWDSGDFDITGYTYGPKNTAGSYTYGFSAGYSADSGPSMGVNFSTEVEGGCKDHSEYDRPLADHTYKVTDKVTDKTLSMTPASSAYIDKNDIDSSDQTLTRVVGEGEFTDYPAYVTESATKTIRYTI